MGPDKKTISVPRYSRIVLTDWFITRYTPRYLRVVKYLNASEAANAREAVPMRKDPITKFARTVKQSPPSIIHQPPIRRVGMPRRQIRTPGQPIVGRRAKGDANIAYQKLIEDETYPISNNVGIGILSFNRLGSIQRLVDSIRRCTDLSRTTLFVSDESTNSDVPEWLANQTDLVYVSNNQRLGVAGNSNRLLKCLSRFKYKILLNDDVEILRKGWDTFYFDAIPKTGIHHFCFRQVGIYGAHVKSETTSERKGYVVNTITSKPQGSVMAFDNEAFDVAGYFDESFGMYGMEHVDWSNRVTKSGIQPPGFHDLEQSEKFFKIWDEESAIPDRVALYHHSREVYRKLSSIDDRVYVKATEKSDVLSISYVIPCRDITGSRSSSIPTVVANIKAQRFPNIEIILMEQDTTARIPDELISPIKHGLVKSAAHQQFNKAAAFNGGIFKTTNEQIVLHDADILVPGWYTRKIYKLLQEHDSCHVGQQVLYLTHPSTKDVNINKALNNQKICDHVVDYFEGGSLGIRKSVYNRIGGFDEKFVGYGVEDCEFYQRIKHLTAFIENRTVKMVHLWHDRTTGWEECHKNNKMYFDDMCAKYNIDQRCKLLRQTYHKKYGM